MNENLKKELLQLVENGKIQNMTHTDDLRKIMFTNDEGHWKLTFSNLDRCWCGEESNYMVSLDRFTQQFICKSCLLTNLEQYDRSIFVNSTNKK